MVIENYEKLNWKDKSVSAITPIVQERLNHNDEGVYQNREYIKEINTELIQVEASIKNVVETSEKLQIKSKELLEKTDEVLTEAEETLKESREYSESAKDSADKSKEDADRAEEALESIKDVEEKANTAVQSVKIGNKEYKTGTIVNLPEYPTSLPASNVTDTYSPTETVPVSGKAVASAIGGLDSSVTATSGYALTSVTETDGKLTAKTEIKIPTTASEVGALASTVTHLSGDIATTEKGSVNGVASLDANGKVPSSQLPSYVDDVLEYTNKASFPTTGETGKIYVDKATNLTWRWSGSAYVEISPSLALGETSSTAYAGDKGKAVTDALATHKADTTVHITSAERTAWNAKTSNTGTVTSVAIKMNGAQKGNAVTTSGTIDLGTVLTGGSQTSTSSDDGGSNVYTFSDGSTMTVKNGSKGSKGEPGSNGTSVSISSTSVTYQASSSGTTIPTGTWLTSVPSVTKGQYLWTKTVVTYSNGTSTTAYSVGYEGTNGKDGVTPTIKAASGSNIGSVGTPSVTASTSGTETTFTFNNLKGAKGDKGDPGQNATTTAVATTSANGLMSSSDKTSLENFKKNIVSSGDDTYKEYYTKCYTNSDLGLPSTSVSDSEVCIALLKKLCTDYPNVSNAIFKGRISPNSQGVFEVAIYSTGEVDSTTKLPRYSYGTLIRYSGGFYKFGTSNFVGYFNTVDTNTTYSVATTSANGLMSSTDKSKLDGIATGATAVNQSTVSDWGFTKNEGTITGIKLSNVLIGTSGEVDLDPVLGRYFVPNNRTINGKVLSGNMTLTASDIKMSDGTTTQTQISTLKTDLNGFQFKIDNGKAYYKGTGADTWSPFNSGSTIEFDGKYFDNGVISNLVLYDGKINLTSGSNGTVGLQGTYLFSTTTRGSSSSSSSSSTTIGTTSRFVLIPSCIGRTLKIKMEHSGYEAVGRVSIYNLEGDLLASGTVLQDTIIYEYTFTEEHSGFYLEISSTGYTTSSGSKKSATTKVYEIFIE